MTRNQRQKVVAQWCVESFGEEHANNLPQRGIRLLEEAIEACQSAGGNAEMAHRLVDFVFARPVGDIGQELGGVSVTLLALAEAAGISADDAEQLEISRVLSKPRAHFKARNEAKNAAGFNTVAPA